VDVCVSPERTAGSNTSDQRRQTVGRTLYYFTVIHLRWYRTAVTATVTAVATTTHALRTITSHTVRWTINVTTGSSRSKTYGRKRSFVRIRMIVRVRARIRACVSFWVSMCVCVCVCACACGGKWQRLQSNGPALSDSDEWHRPGTSGAERGCRSTSRCSAHERARIQTNPALRPKRSEVRNTSKCSNNPAGGDFARTRGRAAVVRGVHCRAEIYNTGRLIFTWHNSQNGGSRK